MKNKKLLTRIFALLASLILVGALAVPCFADAQTSDQDYVINSITFTDGNSAFQWLAENYGRVVKATIFSDGNIYGVTTNVAEFIDGGSAYYVFSTLTFSDFTQDGASSLLSAVIYGYFLRISSESTQLTPAPVIFDFEDGQSTVLNGIASVSVPNTYWSELGFSLTCEYTTEYVPKENTTRSGMFGQLYNILRDAIFGKDVPLDDSQDFVLTQISTWMTYIVILLPLLVVGIVLYRVFVR